MEIGLFLAATNKFLHKIYTVTGQHVIAAQSLMNVIRIGNYDQIQTGLFTRGSFSINKVALFSDVFTLGLYPKPGVFICRLEAI